MKPIVYFKGITGKITPGKPACVFPINHPECTNENWVLTSPVIHGNEKGFETQNSTYLYVMMEIVEPLEIPCPAVGEGQRASRS